MARLRRKGNTPKFRTELDRRVFEITQDMHRQAMKNPAGPIYAPKGMASALAMGRFHEQREKSGEADRWREVYGRARQCQE